MLSIRSYEQQLVKHLLFIILFINVKLTLRKNKQYKGCFYTLYVKKKDWAFKTQHIEQQQKQYTIVDLKGNIFTY